MGRGWRGLFRRGEGRGGGERESERERESEKGGGCVVGEGRGGLIDKLIT
jgi:hypothetical protein